MSAPVDPVLLFERADWLQDRLAGLPKLDHRQGDLIAQRRAFHRACRQLADDLRTRFAARVSEDWQGARISMLGIRSSSTGGLSGTFVNWITAARRKAAQTTGPAASGNPDPSHGA